MAICKALLTTSDYLPQLGGLTSFTLNLEASFRAIGFEYDLYHWRAKERRKLDFKKYDLIFNVHYLGGYLNHEIRRHPRVINFIHGSEILFTSPNLVKRWAKRILKRPQINYFEKSFRNIFISNCTYEKLKERGYQGDHSRDLIFHNCINTEHSKLNLRNIDDDTLLLSCIARDVPHKNLDGTITFAEKLNEISGKKIKLYLTSTKTSQNPNVEVLNVLNISNEKRDEIYSKVHLNLLLSLDHSEKGFYEGFGLSILEGNIYGTPGIVLNSGGLAENVHDGFNGFVIDSIDDSNIKLMWEKLYPAYSAIQKNAHEHVVKYHGLNQYKLLLKGIKDNIERMVI